MKKRIKSPFCLNCNSLLRDEDNFCPNCGQENDNKRKKIGKLLVELVQKFLHFDSKIYHSIPALIFKPGFLSKEYMKGRRQRHLDPVKMFITIMLAYFVISHLGGNEPDPSGNIIYKTTTDSTSSGISFNISTPNQREVPRDSSLVIQDELELDTWYYSDAADFADRGESDPEKLIDSLKLNNNFFNRMYFSQLIKFAKMDNKEFMEYLSAKAPWIIFSMIPVFAFLLKILYVRRKMLYIDHLIFAFHVHAFIFLMGCINALLNLISIEADSVFALIYITYTFLALKNFYRQSWFKTLVKMFLLFGLYSIMSLFTFIFMMLLIFIIY